MSAKVRFITGKSTEIKALPTDTDDLNNGFHRKIVRREESNSIISKCDDVIDN